MIKVTVWHENWHDRTDEATMAMYPGGMHNVIASFLRKNEDFEVRTATLDEENCGLPDEILEDTDVLLWWGHAKHDDVPDELDFQQEIENKETAFRIHEYLHNMEEPYKEVFQLRVFGELSFADIGKIFHKTESWARVTYHRARLKLQEKMQ